MNITEGFDLTSIFEVLNEINLRLVLQNLILGIPLFILVILINKQIRKLKELKKSKDTVKNEVGNHMKKSEKLKKRLAKYFQEIGERILITCNTHMHSLRRI